jgi:hypothetical protein
MSYFKNFFDTSYLPGCVLGVGITEVNEMGVIFTFLEIIAQRERQIFK